jgi:hypothetical protein
MTTIFSSTRLCSRLSDGLLRFGARALKLFAFSTMLACLLSGEVLAGNVSVSYAINSYGQQTSGKLTCDDRTRMCSIASPEMRLRVLLVFGPDMKSVQLSISGEAGCCYFKEGESYGYARVEPGIQRFRFFEGRPRKRNEYIENTPAGTLHLVFLDEM